MADINLQGDGKNQSKSQDREAIETIKSCLSDAGPASIAKSLDESNEEAANRKLRECFVVRTDKNLAAAKQSGRDIDAATAHQIGLETFTRLAEDVSRNDQKGVGCDISVIYGRDKVFIGTDLNCAQEISPLVSHVRRDLHLGAVLSEKFNEIDSAGKKNGRLTEREIYDYARTLPDQKLKAELFEAATRVKDFQKAANDELFREHSGVSRRDLQKMQTGLNNVYENALSSQRAIAQFKAMDTNSNGRIDTAELAFFNAHQPPYSPLRFKVNEISNHVKLSERGAVPLSEIIAKEMKALKKQYDAVY